MLLIDDLHDIRGGAALASIPVQLREIGAVLGVSLGCFATREIAYVLRQDDQLANRFELMPLPRWHIEDPDYWRLLHTFGRKLPLRGASHLTDPKLAAEILARSNGLIGAITRLRAGIADPVEFSTGLPPGGITADPAATVSLMRLVR